MKNLKTTSIGIALILFGGVCLIFNKIQAEHFIAICVSAIGLILAKDHDSK